MLDVKLNGKLNVSKPRDDSIPYPDELIFITRTT